MNNYCHLRTNGFISKAGQELHLQGELINFETKQRTEVKIPISDLIDAFTALSKDMSLNSIDDIAEQVDNTEHEITDNSIKNNQSNTDITEKQETSENGMPSLSQVHAGIDLNQDNDGKSDNKENSSDNEISEKNRKTKDFQENTNDKIKNYETEKDNGKVKDEIVDPDNPFEKEQIDDQLPNFTAEEIAAIDAANKIRTEQNKTALNNLNAGMVDDDDDE